MISTSIYIERRSPIHSWVPRQKLVSLMALMFALASIEHHWLLVLGLVTTALLYFLSGLPLQFLRQRLNYPGLFILTVVTLLPFTVGEIVLLQWQGISLRQEGVAAMALITGRFLAIFTLGLILLGTTPFLDLVKAIRSLGLPPLLADMTLLTYRYLFDIGDRLATMQQAMELRGFSPGWRSLSQWALLVGNLLLRSYEQSERVYKAMVLRGYGQAIPVGTTPQRVIKQDNSWVLTIGVMTTAVTLLVGEVMLSVT